MINDQVPYPHSFVMKPFSRFTFMLAAACLCFSAQRLQAQLSTNVITFGHLNAGALGTNQNDKLVWANGAAFVTNSGYVSMPLATGGVATGFFTSTGPTLSALSGTILPSGLPPAMGSFIQVQMTLISAPAGGSFGFWLTGATAPSFALNVGDSTPLFNLSDPLTAGDPGDDPFGHIHGRRYTSTQMGDYILGLQLFDVSTNGVGSGPIHVPSDTLFVNFRAVPEPSLAVRFAVGLSGLCVMRFNRRQGRS